jgi:hypothetical protein
MPNWCNNSVTLSHSDPKMIERAKDAFIRGELLNEFIPVPKELSITAGREGADDDPKQIALEAAQQSNLKKFGYKDWYDFCVGEWGTKWDIGADGGINDVTDNSLCIYFDSAWAPPVPAYEKLEELGFEVSAYYNEPGMVFCGYYSQGYDDYYDYGGHTSDTVRDVIGDTLDDMWGISESMAEWEAENRDEFVEWYEDGVEGLKQKEQQ